MIIKPKKGEKAKVKVEKVERKPKPKKKSVSSNPFLDETRVYHVAKRADGKWQIKVKGSVKAIKLFDTQMEAIVYAKKMAENQDGKVLIHNSKGKNKGRIKAK